MGTLFEGFLMEGVLLRWPLWLVLVPVVCLALLQRARARPALDHAQVRLFLRGATGPAGRELEMKPLPRSWRTRLAWLPAILCAAGLTALLLALAWPVEQVARAPTPSGLDLVVCLDTSSSMQSRDVGAAGTRWEAARSAAIRFVRARASDRIALVHFARYPALRCPLTRDHDALCETLRRAQPVASESPEDATGIGAALARGVQLFEQADARSRVIVLLTDGEENVATAGAEGEIAPRHAGQLARQLGVRVHPIVVGAGRRDAAGQAVSVDTAPLADVAQMTGGRLHVARDADALDQIYDDIDRLERAPRAEPEIVQRPRVRWLVLLAFLCTGAVALLRIGASHTQRRVARWQAGGVRLDRDRWGVALVGAGLAALGVAWWMAPATEGASPTSGRDLICCLDVSRSMWAQDTPPSRLVRAQENPARATGRAGAGAARPRALCRGGAPRVSLDP